MNVCYFDFAALYSCPAVVECRLANACCKNSRKKTYKIIAEMKLKDKRINADS
jgi:hypothetical protein